MTLNEIWDEVAHHYVGESTGLWPSENRIIQQQFTDRSEKVLIIGGGTGRCAFMIAKLGFNVLCTDQSLRMLELAENERKHYSGELNNRVQFTRMDIVDIKEFPNKFKYIFFPFHGTDHIYPKGNRIMAFKNIKRLMKDNNSIAIVVCRNAWDLIFSFNWRALVEKLSNLFNKNGKFFYHTAQGAVKYYVYSNFGLWRPSIEKHAKLLCEVVRRNYLESFPTVKTSSYFFILRRISDEKSFENIES